MGTSGGTFKNWCWRSRPRVSRPADPASARKQGVKATRDTGSCEAAEGNTVVDTSPRTQIHLPHVHKRACWSRSWWLSDWKHSCSRGTSLGGNNLLIRPWQVQGPIVSHLTFIQNLATYEVGQRYLSRRNQEAILVRCQMVCFKEIVFELWQLSCPF